LFGNVSCGQMFTYKGELCIRTSDNNSGQWEAFNFVRNMSFHIPHTDCVSMVDCELRYENAARPVRFLKEKHGKEN